MVTTKPKHMPGATGAQGSAQTSAPARATRGVGVLGRGLAPRRPDERRRGRRRARRRRARSGPRGRPAVQGRLQATGVATLGAEVRSPDSPTALPRHPWDRIRAWTTSAAGYDVDRIRWHFPALREGAAHFDGPGGTQVPDSGRRRRRRDADLGRSRTAARDAGRAARRPRRRSRPGRDGRPARRRPRRRRLRPRSRRS